MKTLIYAYMRRAKAGGDVSCRSFGRSPALTTPLIGRDEPSFEAERSFVRAPLNSRVVSGIGHRDKGKGKAKETTLYGVPIEIQEALVLEDLLFVLMVRVISAPLGSCLEGLLHFAVLEGYTTRVPVDDRAEVCPMDWIGL